MPDIGNFGPYVSGRWDIIATRYPAEPVPLLAQINHVGAVSPPSASAGVAWDEPYWDTGVLWGPINAEAGSAATWDQFNWNDGSVWDQPVFPPQYPYPLQVRLPQCDPFQALELEVWNRSTDALIVYPPHGGQIEAYGIDSGMLVAPGQTVHCISFGPPQGPLGGAQWYVTDPASVQPFLWLQDDLGGFITTDLGPSYRIPIA